jgi:uncharacterized protein (DUF362 family)
MNILKPLVEMSKIMNIPHQKFGTTTIAKIRDSEELKQILIDPWLDSETIIIKPNWVSTDPGEFTDSETLRTLFKALNGHIIVTESYCLLRSMNILKNGMVFNVGDKEVNWKWLQKGAGWNWLTENPDWEWFKRDGHWEHLKEEDKAFLDRYGFTDLFDEFDVTYVNVTEEVWNGRVANPSMIKQLVESRYRPVQHEQLYSMVPKVLYDLRDSTFISFARLKMYASFTIKNLFGMIPDPLRPWWHGTNNGNQIDRSIVDISKIYHSLFKVYGICEALYTTAYIHPEGEFEGIYTGRYNLEKGSGVIFFGRDLVAIDAMLLTISDPAKRWIADFNRSSIALAEDEFGAVDINIIEEAKYQVFNWLSP